jgi:GT2 family glycosyltransferase
MAADPESLWAIIEARDAAIARFAERHAGAAEKQRILEELDEAARKREQSLEESAEENRRLLAEARAREALLEELGDESRRRQRQLREKEELIEELKASLKEKEEIQKLNATLEEKEAVIHEQARAIQAYRATYAVLGIFIVPLNHLVLGVRSVLRRTIGQFTPRLGVLYQHSPIPVRLPPPRQGAALQSPPRISIVTPSFRQAHFIEHTLRSVLDQGYPNLEYFVQDGGSKDGTVAILERYEKRLAGWESKPDGGQSQAINRAFARTSGEIMAWLNSDDILFPGTLEYVAEFFMTHPEIDVVYGHRVLVNEKGQEIGRWILPPHDDEVLSWADYVPQETLFWRRSIWEKAGGRIDESFRFAMDWDLLLRFREAGARFARLSRFLGAFRVHAEQKTSADIGDIGFAEMDRLRERALGRVPTHMEIRKAVAPYLLRHTRTHLGWRIRNLLGAQT